MLSILIPQRSMGQTAAEMDWVESDAIPTSAPFSCKGMYLPPHVSDADQSDQLNSELVKVYADKATHTVDQQTLFQGSVSAIGKTRSVTSAKMILDNTTGSASMEGPIAMRDEGLLITGSKAISNLDSGEATIDDASFLLHESGLRGEAKVITRTREKHLIITGGEFTRCDPESNTWSLKGGSIKLKPETGFGTATNVTLRIKGVPVGYIPYIKFPIDNERHTGILMPAISFDSDAATDFSLPIYFNISPGMDATYTPRSMWRRGISHQFQYRFITTQTSNEMNAAFLKKDDLYDENILLDQTSAGTGLVPEQVKQDRWFLNFRHSGGTTRRLKSKLNYSVVSDNAYLDDIGGEFGSSTIDQYLNPVDAALSSRRAPVLERLGEIDYRGNQWNLLFRTQGFQSLAANGSNEYERLPQIQFNYSQSGELIEVKSRVDLTRFDAENRVIGDRTVLNMSIATPLRSSWGFFVPEVSVVHRSYEVEYEPTGYDEQFKLTIPRLSLDTGLYFDRFIGTGSEELVHTLEPRLYFLYAQEKDQTLLPRFDTRSLTSSYYQLFRNDRFSGLDRIGDARQLSLGITNRLIKGDSGSELIRFDIGQTYFFKDRKVVLPPQLPGIDHTASASALFSELKVSFSPKWRLTGSLQWEPRSGVTNKGGLSLKYMSDINHILNLTYRYTNKDIEQLGNFASIEESDINFIWPIRGRWSLIGKWNYGWDENKTIESFFGVEYNDCCWKSRLVVRRFLKIPLKVTVLVDDPGAPGGYQSISTIDERAETGIFFEFQLKGLGTLGGRLSSLLDNAIPGYRQREEQSGQ